MDTAKKKTRHSIVKLWRRLDGSTSAHFSSPTRLYRGTVTLASAGRLSRILIERGQDYTIRPFDSPGCVGWSAIRRLKVEEKRFTCANCNHTTNATGFLDWHTLPIALPGESFNFVHEGKPYTLDPIIDPATPRKCIHLCDLCFEAKFPWV